MDGKPLISLNLRINTDAMVMGDASELREVFINMVFNALTPCLRVGR